VQLALIRALLLVGLLMVAGPPAAPAQIFLASRPHPEFTLGPLFIRASVTPALGDTSVDVLFSLVLPPTMSASRIEQDIYFLWPGAIVGDSKAGPPDPALAREVTRAGLSVIDEGRVPLSAWDLYRQDLDGRGLRQPLTGGAPYVTFIRDDGHGISAPATFIRIPWNPQSVNRALLVGLHLEARGLIKSKPAPWLERVLWAPRHHLALGFGDVRQRAVFPLYFWNRDRVIDLSDDPSQLIINFAQADTLKIDELYPQSARRELSETLENTNVVSIFLDSSEGLRPQTLGVQFGYFSRFQTWAPVLFATAFFMLGHLAGPLLLAVGRKANRFVQGRFHIARGPGQGEPRQTGVVIPLETVARIVPGETRYSDVLRLVGFAPEEREQLAAPGRKTLVYGGRRMIPHRKRRYGWVATIDHWDVEHHEVEIDIEHDVVRDVQARVRRTRSAQPTET
jgi:hypothetical protein